MQYFATSNNDINKRALNPDVEDSDANFKKDSLGKIEQVEMSCVGTFLSRREEKKMTRRCEDKDNGCKKAEWKE